MMKLALLFVCLSCQITDCIAAANVVRECEECTVNAAGNIAVIGDLIKHKEPLKIEDLMPPCSQCKAVGLSAVKATEGVDICSFSTDSSKRVAFAVTVPSFTLTCTCEIPCSPKKFADGLTKSGVKMSACGPEETLEGTKATASGNFATVRLTDLVNLAQCAFVVSENMECKDNQNLNDTIELKWSNVDFKFNAFIDKNGNLDRLSDYFFGKFTPDSATCATGDPKFKRSCECLLATKFGEDILVASLTSAIGCDVKSSKDLESISTYLTC